MNNDSSNISHNEKLLEIIKSFPPCSDEELVAAEKRDEGMVPYIITSDHMKKRKK